MKNDSQIIIYQTSDGKTKLQVKFEGETAWLSQAQMAELFDCSIDNISLHLKNIFKEKELDKDSVTEEYSITAADGKKYKTKHYNLDAEMKAEVEFTSYKQERDKKFISDFDKLTRKLLKKVKPK